MQTLHTTHRREIKRVCFYLYEMGFAQTNKKKRYGL